MFAPSPSPSHSPTFSRPHGNAQSAALSRARPSSFSPRHEQRRQHQTPTTPSPRTRIDDPIQSVIAFQSRSPIFLHRELQQQHHPPTQQKRATVDAGTQYTPPGLPPTARPKNSGAVKESSIGAAAASGGAAGDKHEADNEASASRGKAGGDSSAFASAAGPLAGPSDQPHARALSSSSRPSTASQNGERDAADAEGLSEKTPGETRTRVKDVIGGGGGGGGGESRRMEIDDDEVEMMNSSPKKQKQEKRPAKVMPLKYEDCDVKDLGVLVSDMLLELVRHNDALPLKDGQLTRFHSRAPPGISISDYLNRLITHASLTSPLLLSMVYYIDRLCALYPVFTISSLTVHRFLITAATVAAKGLSDSFWTNNTYARVGGVTTRELALLELEFLEKMQWRIVPRPEVLRDYYVSLVERGEGYVIEKEPKKEKHEESSQSAKGKEAEGKQPEVTVKKDDVMER